MINILYNKVSNS